MKKILLGIALLASYTTTTHAMEGEATEVMVMPSTCKKPDEMELKAFLRKSIKESPPQSPLIYKEGESTWKLSCITNFYASWRSVFNNQQPLSELIPSADIIFYPDIGFKEDGYKQSDRDINSSLPLIFIKIGGQNIFTFEINPD